MQGQWCARHDLFLWKETHKPLIQPPSLRNLREVEEKSGPGHIRLCTAAGDALLAWGNLCVSSPFAFPFLSLAVWSDAQVVPFKRVCRPPPASGVPPHNNPVRSGVSFDIGNDTGLEEFAWDPA